MKEVKILDGIIITPFLKAQRSLQQAMAEVKNEYVRDAAIQRFEYTFELAWKTMKRVLDYKGISVNGSKDVFRYAAKEGLIKDPQSWFAFLEMRNQTVHTYNEESAEKVYSQISSFLVQLEKLKTNLLDL